MAKSQKVKTTEDLMFELAKPFPRESIEWRVQRTTKDGTAGLALAYVNARTVQDRLNEVMGSNWQCKHINYGPKTICHLGLKFNDEWKWRSDGAGDTNYEADKGAMSDSFKRSAVMWGIGRHLYDLPSVWVKCETKNGRFSRFTQDPWQVVQSKQSDFS
jgi:hypothetical protein